jgi:putative endopeptidase
MNKWVSFCWIAAMGLCCPFAGTAQDTKSKLDTSGFDRSVRPQDDLYLAVNGIWLKNTEIPAERSNYGSFIALDDLSQDRMREIIEAAAKLKSEPGTDAQKVGDFYRSFMNEERVEKLGLSPLTGELAKIDQLKTTKDLIRYFAEVQKIGVDTPIGAFVDIDDKNSTQYAVTLIQNGTTLPDRSNYLKLDDEKNKALVAALKTYIKTLFELAHLEGAESAADSIVALETKLAEVQWELVELRDADKRYNKFQMSELSKLGKQIDWPMYFEASGGKNLKEVIVGTPSFFEGLDKILSKTPIEVWQSYTRFKLLDGFAPALSKSFDQAHFELHSRTLAGIEEQKPRWKRAVEIIGGPALGESVGKLYVEKHFSPVAKARMDELVKNLMVAYRESINNLSWMSDATKAKAQEKLSKIVTKIGYPDKWRDYSALEVKEDDLVGNLMRSAEFEHQRALNKLGQPIDRAEWGMTPQTVNAYYNPSMNEIVFPAAILQPPFFSVDSDEALNYGGIGAVIGHEISHGFDDQGSKYDGDGNLKNWWTDEDRAAFKSLADRLVKQYDEYSPLPEKKVNGQLTLGENIADLSGLAIAYKAYKISLKGEVPAEIDGWTGPQRFFLGWSQVWRRKYRDVELVKRLLRDPHSPSHYRANGPVCNLDAFYEAFDVKPGDKLFKPPVERIQIW